MKPEDEDLHIKIEIQKTLFTIQQLTSNIKNELGVINEFVNQLGITVDNTIEKMTTVAEDMGINVEVLCNGNEENESLLNLRNLQNSTELQEKIMAYLDNM
ncbi:uncharacterized protein LOC117229725 [Megalopta genalis]|uniref:uncharacterized protein LOC117229725 n=1 Tax=Megalopta genalis TaxID=115081 RepID=UPI003FD63B6E